MVRTHKGKDLNMQALKQQNSHVRAVGNSKMNARGDLIDNNGKVIKSREQLATAYHTNVANAVKTVALDEDLKDMMKETKPQAPVMQAPAAPAPRRADADDAQPEKPGDSE